MSTASCVRAVLAVAALIGMIGCGRSEPQLYPVAGEIFYRDDRPVTSGVIEFAPEDGGPTARGKIGPEGRFSLSTGDRPGAVAGKHRVAIVQIAPTELPPLPGHKHKPLYLHKKYARFETSGLVRTVEAKPENVLLIMVVPAE